MISGYFKIVKQFYDVFQTVKTSEAEEKGVLKQNLYGQRYYYIQLKMISCMSIRIVVLHRPKQDYSKSKAIKAIEAVGSYLFIFGIEFDLRGGPLDVFGAAHLVRSLVGDGQLFLEC